MSVRRGDGQTQALGRPPSRGRDRVGWQRRVEHGLQAVVGLWIVVVGSGLLWMAGPPAWVRISGAGLVGLGLVATVGVVLRARARPPAPTVGTADRVATTTIARERTVFAAGMAMVAVASLTCLGWGLLALGSGHVGWSLILWATAVWTGSPVVLAAAGRYTAGGIWLTPETLTYRSRGLRTTIAWDGVGLVVDDVARGHVVFRSLPGTVVRHEFRAGPWRGEKVAAPDVGILRTEGLTLGPATLARVVDHYAHRPATRSEIGTPASLATIIALRDGA